MSIHQGFRRMPVPGEMAMRHATMMLPAPIRGLMEIENWSFTKPGSAAILENWFPTQRGLKLRGGSEEWATAGTAPLISAFSYISGNVQRMFAASATKLYDVTFAGTGVEIATVTNGNYSAAQLANMGGDWLIALNDDGDYPRRYDGTTWTYLSVTTPADWLNSHAYAVNDRALDTADRTYWKCLVAHTSPGSGTFAAARAAAPTQWEMEMAPDEVSWITGPADTPVENGQGLTHVWKYRGRMFFIEGGTMNAWYLPLNAAGGILQMIPLSGAASRGGSLLFGATWSVSAGDGLDDKCCFFTDQGEVLIFSGSDPSVAANWRQEGRYDISRPLGKNASVTVGGDLLVETVDGIVPLVAILQKDVSQLSLAAITINVEPTWMREVKDKDAYPWTVCKFDESNALYANFPGGAVGSGDQPNQCLTLVINLHTGAATIYRGWDTMCFVKSHKEMFFGTQQGKIMQAEATGKDNAYWNEDTPPGLEGHSYVAKMVGGWEMFQAPPNQVTWLQARASFFSNAAEPFQPQIAACTDYVFRIPQLPPPGPDPGRIDVWDIGLWDEAIWDAEQPPLTPVRNTMWVSIGETGFSHAPICQVTVNQTARPDVELVSIAATFIRMAANV